MRAAKYLRSQGYRIIASGFRVAEGEIDLIAWEGETLAFVEVKSRKTMDLPEVVVGFTKRQRVVRAARAYIARYRLHEATYRFDIVAVNEVPGQKPVCRLLRDAFRPPN